MKLHMYQFSNILLQVKRYLRVLNQKYHTIPRWNLSFDGTTSCNVHDFMYRLEQMARDDGFPERALTKVLHLFLSKTAEDWYWIFKLDNLDASWQSMKSAMMSYFSTYDFEEELREQINRRHQSNKETFSEFALSIQKLNARLRNRLSDKEIIYRLCQNMLPALRNVTLPAQNLINSVEELRVLCQRYERMWDQTGYDPRRFYDAVPKRRQINELSHEMQEMNLETPHNARLYQKSQYNIDGNEPVIVYGNVHSVEAFQRANKPFSKEMDKSSFLVCWNCRDMGHRYQDCTEDFLEIFCFGCGATGVRKPNCANCIRFATGNNQPNVNVSRVTHSGRNSNHQLNPRDPTNQTDHKQNRQS